MFSTYARSAVNNNFLKQYKNYKNILSDLDLAVIYQIQCYY